MSLTIRIADLNTDFSKILYGAGEFVTLVNEPTILPGSRSQELVEAVADLTALPGIHVLLAEDGARLVGGIGLLIGPFVWDKTKVSCEEIFWWCEPEAPPAAAMMLLREARNLGLAKGASIITLHRLVSSPKGVDVAYRRMKTREMQTTYIGVLS